MARKVRISYPGAVYHVMARGNERAKIFNLKSDYELFLGTLKQALDMRRQIGEKDPLDWKKEIKMGLVVGDEKMSLQVKTLLQGKGRETGLEIGRRLERGSRGKRLARHLAEEKDLRNRIWIRVKLLGESQVEIARELGYRSSVSIHQIAKRVEERAAKDDKLHKKIQLWKKTLNVID